MCELNNSSNEFEKNTPVELASEVVHQQDETYAEISASLEMNSEQKLIKDFQKYSPDHVQKYIAKMGLQEFLETYIHIVTKLNIPLVPLEQENIEILLQELFSKVSSWSSEEAISFLNILESVLYNREQLVDQELSIEFLEWLANTELVDRDGGDLVTSIWSASYLDDYMNDGTFISVFGEGFLSQTSAYIPYDEEYLVAQFPEMFETITRDQFMEGIQELVGRSDAVWEEYEQKAYSKEYPTKDMSEEYAKGLGEYKDEILLQFNNLREKYLGEIDEELQDLIDLGCFESHLSEGWAPFSKPGTLEYKRRYLSRQGVCGWEDSDEEVRNKEKEWIQEKEDMQEKNSPKGWVNDGEVYTFYL